MEMAQVTICSQTNTKHINAVWAERTVVKIFNLLVHPVTVGFKRLNVLVANSIFNCSFSLSVHTVS
jgi:hypothetical protein